MGFWFISGSYTPLTTGYKGGDKYGKNWKIGNERR